jgi:hypothetical protein
VLHHVVADPQQRLGQDLGVHYRMGEDCRRMDIGLRATLLDIHSSSNAIDRVDAAEVRTVGQMQRVTLANIGILRRKLVAVDRAPLGPADPSNEGHARERCLLVE